VPGQSGLILIRELEKSAYFADQGARDIPARDQAPATDQADHPAADPRAQAVAEVKFMRRPSSRWLHKSERGRLKLGWGNARSDTYV